MKNTKKNKKIDFFLNLELPQSQILRFGPRCGWSDISSQFFLRLSGRKGICLCFLRRVLEKLVGLKKNHEKKVASNEFYDRFSEKKIEKKIEIFTKKNF